MEEPRPTPPPWAHLHLWQLQPVRDVLLGLGLVGLFLLGHEARVVTVPLLLALLFAYLFEPLVRRLTRARWIRRPVAAGGLVVAFVVLVGVPAVLGGIFAVIQGVRLASDVAARIQAVQESRGAPEDEALREELGDGAWGTIRDALVEYDRQRRGEAPEDLGVTGTFFGIDAADVAATADALLGWLQGHSALVGKHALETGTDAVGAAFATLGRASIFLFGAFLTAFFFFFLSSGWERVTEFARGLLPVRNREHVIDILRKMDVAISGFIRGRLTIAFFLAIFYSVGFSLMGVPAPLLLGPAIALLALVPYAAVAGIPVVIVLLWLENHTGFRGATWWIIGAPIVWYNVGQLLDDYVLTPVIQGRGTDLDTPTILFASIAGGALMGFYGLLVAIPLAACLKILIREVFWPRFRAWAEGKERDFLPIDED